MGKVTMNLCSSGLSLLILTAAVKSWADMYPCQRDTYDRKCSVVAMSCDTSEQALILEAFFESQSVCDKNCVSNTSDPTQCKVLHGKCRQRLTLEDLNSVYSQCDSNPSYCNLDQVDKRLLSAPRRFHLDFICLAETATIDPCSVKKTVRTTASMLLRLSKSACNTTCDIVPPNAPGDIQLSYYYLRNSSSDTSLANLRYQIIHGNDRKPDEKFYSSYYQEGYINTNVSKIQIWFDIPDPRSVTRLWVYFHDLDVEVSCRPADLDTGISTKQGGSSGTRPVTLPGGTTKVPTVYPAKPSTRGTVFSSQSTRVPLKSSARSTQRPTDNLTREPPSGSDTEQKDETEEDNTGLITVIISVSAAVVVLAAVVVVVVVVVRRKRNPKTSSREGGSDGTVPSSTNQDDPGPGSAASALYSECAPTSHHPHRSPHPSPSQPRELIMTPLTGNDVEGEYGRLQHGCRVMVAPPGGSETYDHVAVGQSDDVYNRLQREHRRQEVVDNVYNCASP